MTGPEHYREAEWLIAQVTETSNYSGHRVLVASEYPGDSAAEVLALAQVHATLALAAAQAMTPGTRSVNTAERRAWAAAAETPADAQERAR